MLDIRPIDMSPAGIARTCKLLNVVYPHAPHLTTAYLDRLYNGNPLGPTFGFSAFENDELVGHYLMIPIAATIFGKPDRGIWPFQLATHPGFRGKGLFTALVERSFDAARERGFTFFAGVGNQNSTPLFVGKWGFQSICQLDVKLGVGPIPESRAGSDFQLLRTWDAPGIAWRLQHPAAPYRVQFRDGIGHLFAPAGKAGIWVQVGSFPEEMLPAGLEPLRTPNPLRLYIAADSSRDFSRSLYVTVPMKYRPSPLNLLFYDLTDQKRRFDPKLVRYDLFDFDAY
ncbi:MAG TPA: GNAT family N-acetyltransferase [Polyangiaceae bacterium]|nr:GNAT family N-acetyltransferase [Polyangiaceae bacterium]